MSSTEQFMAILITVLAPMLFSYIIGNFTLAYIIGPFLELKHGKTDRLGVVQVWCFR
jgi:hypothetical protein